MELRSWSWGLELELRLEPKALSWSPRPKEDWRNRARRLELG
jgi:hypothetical protein